MFSFLSACRLYAYEGVGMLLGQEDLAADEQHAYVAALLQPLIHQVCAATFPVPSAEKVHPKQAADTCYLSSGSLRPGCCLTWKQSSYMQICCVMQVTALLQTD